MRAKVQRLIMSCYLPADGAPRASQRQECVIATITMHVRKDARVRHHAMQKIRHDAVYAHMMPRCHICYFRHAVLFMPYFDILFD